MQGRLQPQVTVSHSVEMTDTRAGGYNMTRRTLEGSRAWEVAEAGMRYQCHRGGASGRETRLGVYSCLL